MGGKRILVSGMGGELGTRVAALLEEQPWVGEVVGVDVDPHHVVHLGVYEPNARSTPTSAAVRTEAAAVAVLGAAVECPSLEAMVVRSGIEVYGRRRGAVARPDESVAPDPTSPFGCSLLAMEEIAVDAGRASGRPVTLLRFAPVIGPHVASPLGRYLRLPVVPLALLADPPFTLLHVQDAAEAVVAAARSGVDGPLNVVAAGAVTPLQAVRLGGRLPVPVAGPPAWLARAVAELAGAPAPGHLVELLTRGRVADGGRAAAALGIEPSLTTTEVVKELFRWASVTHLRPAVDEVA